LGAEHDKEMLVRDIDIQNTTIVYQKTGKQIDENTAKLNLTNVKLIPEKQ